jgi:hypothetical protein
MRREPKQFRVTSPRAASGTTATNWILVVPNASSDVNEARMWRASVWRASFLPEPCGPIVVTAGADQLKGALGGLPTAHIDELDTDVLKKSWSKKH